LPYKTNEDLLPLIKQYSSVVRYSYCRFHKDNKSEKEIYELVNTAMNNIELLGSRLRLYAIKDGKAIQTRFGDQTVIFGGKRNFINRCKNKISKEEYKLNRLTPVCAQGDTLNRGNMFFELDIIDNNQIIFKLNKDKHIIFELPILRTNIKKELFKLQKLNEVKCGENGYKYTVRFDLDYVYISFEEFKNEDNHELNENRYMGIDMNPDTIGISIFENDTIIHTQEFSLKPIFNKIFDENLSSDSNKMKYYQNKLKYETFEISKSISKLAIQFNCKSVFIEDLHFKDSTKHILKNQIEK